MERETLIFNLHYLNTLLTAMGRLNEKELSAQKQFRNLMRTKAEPTKTVLPKHIWVILVIIVYIVAAAIGGFMLRSDMQKESGQIYEAMQEQNMTYEELMSWYDRVVMANFGIWGIDDGEYSYGEAYLHGFIRSMWWLFWAMLVICAITLLLVRLFNYIAAYVYKGRIEKYRNTILQNKKIGENNQRIQEYIEELHVRKQLISQECVEKILPWFPREYCYHEAINYFIHELEIGTASNLAEAIMNYREYQYRRGVANKLSNMSNMLNVMINNQQVVMSQQEEIVRQQIVGNCINAATLNEARNIADSARSIEFNTQMTAANTGWIARNINRR